MDEPTSVLTPQEAETLFDTLRRLAAEGCSILYISHKLEEIRALCDTATIMRLGRVVAHCDPREKSAKELAELMINAELEPHARSRRVLATEAPPRLVVDKLTVASPNPFGADLKEISFAVAARRNPRHRRHRGQRPERIDGRAVGRSPRRQARDHPASTASPVGHMGPRERRALGGCFVPEERNGHGAVGAMTLSDNGFLTAEVRRSLARFGFVRSGAHSRIRPRDHSSLRRAHHRPQGPGARALGRQSAEVPGRARDHAGADRARRQSADLGRRRRRGGGDPSRARRTGRERRGGRSIISQDLDEIFLICDRIAVIAGGRLSPPIPVAEATIEQIGLLMGGAKLPRRGGPCLS